MKKLFKWILKGSAVLVALLVILVGVALVVFDGEQLKVELAEQVKAKTSADLTIEKDLELSFFPWLAIATGDVTLSQPAGFKSELDFAKIGQLKASVQLIPLFSGQIKVGSVELDDLQLNLLRDSRGGSNLQQLTSYMDKQKSSADEQAGKEQSSSEESASFSLQKLVLKNLELNQYTLNRKRQAKLTQQFALEHFELDKFASDTFVPVQAAGSLKSGSGKTEASWGLGGSLKVSADYKKIELKDLNANISDLSQAIQQLKLEGDSSVALNADKTQVEHQGRVLLNQQPLDVVFKGTFSSFKDIYISLNGDTLDLKHWVEGESKPSGSESASADFSPIADFLKRARIKGDLSVASLKVKNMDFSKVEGKIFNKGTTLWLKPFSANAFKGSLATSASINFAAKPIALSVQPNLSNIEVGDLLATMFDVERLTGLGTLDLNMQTKGLNFKQMMQNLSGNGSLDLADGALNGLDLNKLIESGISLDLMNNSDAYKGKTNFAALAGNLVADKGIIKLNDFAMKSPLFELLGKATTNANKETIGGNFQLVLKGQLKTLMEEKYPQLTDKTLPLKIKGSWQEPKATIDFESLLKDQLQSELEDKLGGKLKDKRKDLEDELKDKLKDSLFDKFKKGK